MKYLDEYRDADVVAQRWPTTIARTVTRPWTIMEVCGGQTHTIVRYGHRRAAAGARSSSCTAPAARSA